MELVHYFSDQRPKDCQHTAATEHRRKAYRAQHVQLSHSPQSQFGFSYCKGLQTKRELAPVGEEVHRSHCQGTDGQQEATRATSIIDARGIGDVVHPVCMLAEGILMMN